ncbi:tetratricopeptide repeat protein [Striga asiatica]|uniref:Tetratricopeptide repeat protein n=1 Tax=Striga asiatica TaxID=4170 RepID=A0A5A7PWX6_STRAF|nr:tetratricopeptide repeat protein [Striga asiatica]
MKLNPTKCNFGVRSGNFLGYLVTENDIDVNSWKVKPVLEMQASKSLKEEVQAFDRLKEVFTKMPLLTKPELMHDLAGRRIREISKDYSLVGRDGVMQWARRQRVQALIQVCPSTSKHKLSNK